MKLKTILILTLAVALGACSSGQSKKDSQAAKNTKNQQQTVAAAEEKEETPQVYRPKTTDRVVAQQARQNRKLYKQSAEKMYRTRQLPAITYEFDVIRPPEYAYPFMDKIALIMNTHENLHLVLEGHADLVGTKEYNYWISSARAAAMKSYLVSRGISADRIHVYGYGSDRPLTLDESPEGRRTNRRVEFKFTTREWNAIY